MNISKYKINNTTRIIIAFDKISKVFALMESFADDISLSKPELLSLEITSNQNDLTMSELAMDLGIGFSTATAIIDRLVEKKLVNRKRNLEDRRIVKVSLSKKGEEIVLAYQKQKRESFQKMIKILTVDEQECFALVLEKIANKILEEKEDK